MPSLKELTVNSQVHSVHIVPASGPAHEFTMEDRFKNIAPSALYRNLHHFFVPYIAIENTMRTRLSTTRWPDMLRLSVLILGLVTLASESFAQNETLLIGPGDLVHIQVFDTPEMDQHIRVADAGTVPLVFVGDTKIAGMTPADAGHVIERALIEKRLMLHPQVTVTVEQYATQNVSVMGQVKNPGNYPITTPQSIIKVLALAGGVTDVADRNLTIQRGGDEKKTINYFLSNQSDKAFAGGVMVNPGDTVLVPKAPIIYVLGDVGRPGGFSITTNNSKMTALQAIALAGSFQRSAVPSKSKLIRKGPNGQQELPLQLAAIQKGKQPDVELQADDIIYVPFSFLKNVATGAAQITAQTASAAIYVVR